MDATDVIALSALALSVALAIAQAIGAFRRRRRVTVSVATGVQGDPRATGGVYNRQIVIVTVRSIGANHGVDSLDFEWESAPAGFGVEPAPMPGPFAQLGLSMTLADITDVLGVRGVLQDGESRRWQLRVTAPQSNAGIGAGVDEVMKGPAVVTLTSGKRVRSDIFFLAPDSYVPPGASLNEPPSRWFVTSATGAPS